jgi:hypothetical protein
MKNSIFNARLTHPAPHPMATASITDDTPQFGFRASEDVAIEIRQFAKASGKSLTDIFVEGARLVMKGAVAQADTAELVGGPLLDVHGACGAPNEARQESTTYVISRRVAEEIHFDPDTDFFIRGRGESMEGRGILDEFVVAMSPLRINARPRIGKIALVAFTDEHDQVTGTIKEWKGESSNGVPRLVDGNGVEFSIPEGTVKAVPIAIAKGVIGEL